MQQLLAAFCIRPLSHGGIPCNLAWACHVHLQSDLLAEYMEMCAQLMQSLRREQALMEHIRVTERQMGTLQNQVQALQQKLVDPAYFKLCKLPAVSTRSGHCPLPRTLIQLQQQHAEHEHLFVVGFLIAFRCCSEAYTLKP